MRYLQLGGLLNHNQPFVQRNVIEQSFHEGGLAGTRSTADNAVLPLANQAHHGISNSLRQAARCNQFVGREPAVEFPNGERRPIDGGWSAHDGDARAVRQARIQDGILRRKVLSKDAGDALNGSLQALVAVRCFERNMLDYAAAIGIDPGSPVNHQIGDRRVQEERPQLLGEERQNQVEAHRVAPVVGSVTPAGLRMVVPGSMGSTETRFSWNSVMVSPNGLMNSYCG